MNTSESAHQENMLSAASAAASAAKEMAASLRRIEKRLARTRMTDEQIKHMADRFLSWRLPEHFHPDAGISFKPSFSNEPLRSRHWPVGTNLFDAMQAEAMVLHMIEGLPAGEAE